MEYFVFCKRCMIRAAKPICDPDATPDSQCTVCNGTGYQKAQKKEIQVFLAIDKYMTRSISI